MDLSPRVSSTAAMLPHRSKKATRPNAAMRRGEIEREMGVSMDMDMSPRVPSTAAMLPPRSKKATHPNAAMRRGKIERGMT
eukprot:scaffold803_cov96-Skeletonema_dohrnii-CCMP3373.AAC.1